MTVQLDITGEMALITIDNPPVNVISADVRGGLMDVLDRVESADVARVILTGAGRCFVAGADVREFGAPPVPPHLPDILTRIEAFPVPCAAAINGAALGGGLEIALACRWRVAAPSATLGLPEVTLGVVPGAGGTQRLPRLIGLAGALELIPQGKVIGAEAAHKMGLLDALADDPVAAARSLEAGALAATVALCDRPAPALDDSAVEAARKAAAKRMAGQVAPPRAIELVAGATLVPLDEGLKVERETFLELRDSDQARALRHVFFAERAAVAQARAIVAEPAELTHAVVVGGGNMGASIAYGLAGAGIRVTIVEVDDDGAGRAREAVEGLYDQAVRSGRTTPETAATDRAERLDFVVGYEGLPRAEIAIEAAFEDLAVKQEIFAALDAALPRSTILATNTSYLDVNRIAESVRDQSRVLGLHFFSPAHIMKLLEVVRGRQTSDRTLATVLRLARRLDKIPVQAAVCDGFIGNRILTRYRQSADIMLLEGALPWQIDEAMRGFGFAMGPYEVQDLSGLDIAYANRTRLGLRDRDDLRYVPIADRMVEELGRLGRKTDCGWYDYPEGKPRVASGAVEELIVDAARREDVQRRTLGAAEIRERALAVMVEEACHILEEGIAARPADVDLVMIHGYSFPRWRGGLMYYADALGLPALLDRLDGYARQDPKSWSSSELLRRLVCEGHALASLN